MDSPLSPSRSDKSTHSIGHSINMGETTDLSPAYESVAETAGASTIMQSPTTPLLSLRPRPTLTLLSNPGDGHYPSASASHSASGCLKLSTRYTAPRRSLPSLPHPLTGSVTLRPPLPGLVGVQSWPAPAWLWRREQYSRFATRSGMSARTLLGSVYHY